MLEYFQAVHKNIDTQKKMIVTYLSRLTSWTTSLSVQVKNQIVLYFQMNAIV